MARANHSKKNYLKLFDYIDKQTAYDEEDVKRHFARQAFVRQLHVTKNYLNAMILKSLRSFHARQSVSQHLKRLLQNVEILFKRELFNQCERSINQGLQLARRYERLPDLAELLGWKRRLILETEGQSQGAEKLNELLEEEKSALEKNLRIHDYWNITINLFDFLKTPEERERIYPEPVLLEDISMATTVQARLLYHHINYAKKTIAGHLEAGEAEIRSMIAYLESQPAFVSEDPTSYVTAVTNLIGFYLRTKKIAPIPELLERIKKVPATYGLKEANPLTIKVRFRTYNIELEYCRDTKQFDRATALGEEISEFFEKYVEKVPLDYRLLIFYQLSYVFFMKKDYQKALMWLNRIFRSNYGLVREDIQSYAQLLNLILHFELGNTIILKYAVASCRRFLRKKRDLCDFEKVLLRFFSKITMATKDKYHELFIRLSKELFAQTSEHEMHDACDYLDFKEWIATKLDTSC